MTLRDHAESIARAAAPRTAIPVVTIITIVAQLLPMLAQCWSQTQPNASAKRFVAARWNERKQQYRGRFIENHVAMTMQAAQESGQIISDSDAEVLTREAFDHIRTQDDDTVTAGYSLALACA